MSMRKWNMDFELSKDTVIATIDITGISPEELFIGISPKLNSLVLKYSDGTRDIPIPVKVTEEFEHVINNGVLIVTIKRLQI